MFRWMTSGCAAAACLLAAPALAAGPYGLVSVGNWKGGAYTSDATGRFSHCAAGASYRSGIYFMVAMTAEGSWGLGFAHNDWNLNLGDAFPIGLTFDGREQFNVFGKAITDKSVLVPMPNNSSLMSQFRKAIAMSAMAKGRLFQFKLDGTSQLIPVLASCVTTVRSKGIRHAGHFTVRQSARTAVPVEATSQPQSSGSLTGNFPPNASNELQFEAMEVASNFIIKSELRNARLLSRSETPTKVASLGAAWRSDEATGFVKIFPPDGKSKGLDVAAAIISADAKECKGKFASGRTSELVDSEVVFRGFASCDDSEGARIAQYFVLPRRKGGFVMISVVTDLKSTSGKAITKDDRMVGLRNAALVAVSQ